MESLNDNFLGLLSIVIFILFLIVIFKIFLLPIRIAERKILTNNEVKTIKILTWLGLFSGFTWIIALCLALFYEDSFNKKI